MGSWGTIRRIVIVTIAVTALFVAGFVGASSGSRWTAEQALALDAHDVTITRITTAHHLVLSTHALESQRELGLVADSDWHGLIDGARRALAIPASARLAPTSRQALIDYQIAATAYLDRLSSGSGEMADKARTEVEVTFGTSIATLDADRLEIRRAVETDGMGSFASHTAFGVLVGLVVPLAAVLAYRWTARRHVESVREEARHGRETDRETLLSGLAHELRTPLTGIAGFADLLGERALDPGEAAEVAQLIGRESAELSRRVDDLMTTARLRFNARTTVTTDVHLPRLIGDLAAYALPKDPVVLVDGDPVLRTDEQLLNQAVRNLIVNARDHGGPSVRIRVTERAGLCEIAVEDDGSGLDPETVERIVQPFHHGTRAMVVGSLGMGLSTVRAIADRLGGELRYESRAGWNRFVLALPQRLTAGQTSDPVRIR